MLRKMLIGFAILFLLLAGAGVYLYLKGQPILHEAEARQKMLQPRPIKGKGILKGVLSILARVWATFRKYVWAGLRIAKALTSPWWVLRAPISLTRLANLRRVSASQLKNDARSPWYELMRPEDMAT